MSYVLAWLLPWLTGTGLCLALTRGPRARGDVPAAMGAGFLLGLLLTAVLAAQLASGDTDQAFVRTAPWLSGIGLLAWAAVYALRHRGPRPQMARLSRGWQAICIVLLLALGFRLWLLGSEAWLRPVFPWDAWTAWAVKPKTWFLLDHWVPFVAMDDWLAVGDGAVRTMPAWRYPDCLAWIEIWFASAAGGWNEPLVNLVWCGVLAALGLASYGHWRALGVSTPLALGLVYAMLSLPLLNAHVALAGYADLWLTALFGLAVLAWLRWLHRREYGQLVLALIFAFSMPFIKLEGSVWLLLLTLVIAAASLQARWRWLSVGGLLLVGAGALLSGGLALPLLGLGVVHISWGQIVIPALGSLDLYWRPVGTAMLAGLFTLPNWHLLWYALPVIVLLRWRRMCEDRATGALAAMLAMCGVFLVTLFFLTDASRWAADFTSANRLIMHVVPAVMSLLALLLAGFSPAPADTDPAPNAPNAAG